MANDIKIGISLEGKDALKTLNALTKGVDRLGSDGTKSVNSMTGAVKVFQGVVGAQVLLKSIDLVGRALQQGARNALEFGKNIAEINSIAPRTALETLALKQQLIGLSNEFGGKAQKQARAFYNIVSAGVKGTAEQLNVLESANKAAVAGLVDIDTSARVLVASVNSYASSGLTAAQASDILFNTVKEGITTFGEIANSIGVVAPLASAAGLKFSELGGALAFVTKSGLSTAEAATGLRAVLTGVIKPSVEAAKAAKEMKIQFTTAAIKEKGFTAFLADVIEKTNGSEVALAKLFPNVRALGPILQIANGDFQDFIRIMDSTAESTGATEKAFKTITDSAAFQFEKLTNQLVNFPTALLTNFDEPLSDSLKAINDFVGAQGILLLASGVETVISAFQAFIKPAAEVDQFLNFLGASLFGTALAWNEFILSANGARQAIADFTGEDGHLNLLKEEEAQIRKNILVLEQSILANEKATVQSQQDAQKRVDFAEKLRKDIAAGKAAQVEGDQARRDKEVTDDKELAAKKLDVALEAEKDKFNALKELKEANKELVNEGKEEEKLAKELEGEEEFIRLEEALGRETTARELNRISQIDGEKKRIAELKKLNEKADAAAAKTAKTNSDRDIKLARTTTQAKLNILSSSLALAEALNGKSSKAIFFAQKALAIAQIIVSGNVAEAAALAPPPLGAGPVVGLPLAGLIRANTVIQVATVAATTANSAGNFQSGGIVEGASQTGDQLTANVNGGEAIFNRRQQQNLFNAVDSGSLGGGSSNITINAQTLDGTIPQESIDSLIDQINDRTEFGNKTLGAA